jgi:preprotein translocase subunit SecF
MATLFGIFGLTGLDEAGFFGYIIALVFGIAVMTWGYRKFRYGGEIEEGTGIVKTPKNKQKVTAMLAENGVDSMAVVKNMGSAVAVGAVLNAFLSASRR